jgi:hypothetical protein
MALIFLSIFLTPLFQEGRTGRLRPPDSLNCDRNKLTSFTGIVNQWSRDDAGARLAMRTDAETNESFVVRFDKPPHERWFLLEGQVFRSEDWAKVESFRGRLLPGMKATVWVCEGSANPVTDWRPPPK